MGKGWKIPIRTAKRRIRIGLFIGMSNQSKAVNLFLNLKRWGQPFHQGTLSKSHTYNLVPESRRNVFQLHGSSSPGFLSISSAYVRIYRLIHQGVNLPIEVLTTVKASAAIRQAVRQAHGPEQSRRTHGPEQSRRAALPSRQRRASDCSSLRAGGLAAY